MIFKSTLKFCQRDWKQQPHWIIPSAHFLKHLHCMVPRLFLSWSSMQLWYLSTRGLQHSRPGDRGVPLGNRNIFSNGGGGDGACECWSSGIYPLPPQDRFEIAKKHCISKIWSILFVLDNLVETLKSGGLSLFPYVSLIKKIILVVISRQIQIGFVSICGMPRDTLISMVILDSENQWKSGVIHKFHKTWGFHWVPHKTWWDDKRRRRL